LTFPEVALAMDGYLAREQESVENVFSVSEDESVEGG